MPKNDYTYEFPLKNNPNAPVPSNANYKPQNVAWVSELLSGVIGTGRAGIRMKYENNSPYNRQTDIVVDHPDDQDYYNSSQKKKNEGSYSMIKYERAAKKSRRLSNFNRNAPTDINYFRNSGRNPVVGIPT